jgi:glycosyltransferase involved in cell wall biosynthesis
MIKDKVSIIVPLYNYKDYIVELIDSVENQNYDPLELIIVDDCSTDDPCTVIDPYISDKIKYFRLDENKGYATAKNEGIIKSNGEYIVVLDADDMLSPKSIIRRVAFMKRKEAKWLHAKAYEFSNAKPYKFVWRKRQFIRRFEKMKKNGKYKNLWNTIHAQTVMVHRSAYLKVGLYRESMRSMSDKEMWARLQFNVGLPAYFNKFVAYYRMHKNQMHRSKSKKKNLPNLLKQLNDSVKRSKKGDFSEVRKLNE